jgi:RNA polymerase primary sigma factor
MMIKFIGSSDFDNSTATAEILGPMPGPAGTGTRARKARSREAYTLADAGTQDFKFLTREQEIHLFRKMNFLKYQAAQLQEAINRSHARHADVDRVEELLEEAGAIRNRIICSYLGLVVSIVRKWTRNYPDFSDLVSEGHVSLIQASERFDFTRGTRFSTYATQVIINDFVRRVPRDRRRRVRFATSHEGLLQAHADYRDSGLPATLDGEPTREIIKKMLHYLDDREQKIIVRRFGLAGDRHTLVKLSQELGISKERVRQLQTRALDKLRTLDLSRELDPTEKSN